MRKLSSFDPFGRSATGSPRAEEGSSTSAETSAERLSTQNQTAREDYGLFTLAPGASVDGNYIDIVAVHGLGGHWEATWTDAGSNCLWLRDLVPKQSQEANLRITSFGYDSKTAFTNSAANINDAAIALIMALDGLRRISTSGKSPIIFVAHSLGGIIVKRAINLAIERSEQWKHIADSVHAIVFFAVPHYGAETARWASVVVNMYRLATLGFKGNANFVKALKVNSPQFEQISEAFIERAATIKTIRTFYETTKIANKIIVDKSSAVMRLKNEIAMPIQGSNHRDICKFSSEESQRYQPVRDALQVIIERARDRLDEITNSNKLNMTTRKGSQDSVSTDSGQQDFLGSLHLPRMLDCLEWQHTSTYHQWLFLNETFTYWLKGRDDSNQSRLLWVIGAPCSGKTTAISGAYHRLLQEKDVVEGRHQVAAYFFQHTEEPRLRSPNAMYRAILFQILDNQLGMIPEVLESCRKTAIRNRPTSDSTTSKTPFDPGELDCRSLLLHALRISCVRFERVTIFVDALDEFWVDEKSFHEARRFDGFLSELSKLDEFLKLRLCLSSRNLGALDWCWLQKPISFQSEQRDEGTEVLMIEVQTDNRVAIHAYIDEQLRLYSRDTDELVAIKKKLEEMSMGNFLWAQSMVDRLIESLRQHQASQLSIRTQPVPRGLKTEYSNIFRRAEEPLKTWRLFQWMFLAPDLGLKGWRDLIPFLRDKTPSSLKKARGLNWKYQDWAVDLHATPESDQWVTELGRIICRLSLGLAQVAPLPPTSNDEPIDDYHSAAGEAGSWVTADGNKWVVRPVHHSVQRFLLDDNGLDILNPKVKDHGGAGLLMAMTTCLDFINAREFSGLNVFSSISISQGSGDSFLSDGDASAMASISSGSISSAWSIRHNPGNPFGRRTSPGGSRSHSSGSIASSTTVSSEKSEMNEADLRVAVLAHLKQDAVRYPSASQDKRKQIRDWLQSLEGALDDPNPATDSSLGRSSPNKELVTWTSELLAYVMTAFPRFAKAAEGARVHPRVVITKLREGGLWARLRCLCEGTGEDTSLKQWAESQALQTWVTCLACDKVNPYICPKPYTSPNTLQAGWLTSSRWDGLNMDLKYCLDGGTSSIIQLESTSTLKYFPLVRSNRIELGSTDPAIEDHLQGQLLSAMAESSEPGGMGYGFIPQRSLRRILSKDVVATLLQKQTGLDPDRVVEIRERYMRVLAILLLISEVSQMQQLFQEGVDDECLPIKVKPQDPKSWEIVILESQVPGKGDFATDGLEYRQWYEFEQYQWSVLSPFLAKPDGCLQHYKLVSKMQPLPIVECKSQQLSEGYLGYELQERIRFHHESFDFGEDKMYGYTSNHSRLYTIWRLRRVTWKRFLSIIYAWKLVGEEGNTKSGVIPLLCTLERPCKEAPSKFEFDLIFPYPQGDLNDLTQVEPGRSAWSGQLTEIWLAKQCCQLATSLSVIHRIAALKVPNLPRLRFFRSGRLENDVIKWLSSSEGDLGDLVFSNFSTQPPSPASAAPEYFIYLNRPQDHRNSISSKHKISSQPSQSTCGLGNNESPDKDELQISQSDDLALACPSFPSLGTSGHCLGESEQVGPQEATPGHSNVRSQSPIRASKFQVWCFGTILLRLITWFLLGPQGIKDHEDIFAPQDDISGFIEISGLAEVGENHSSRYRLKAVVLELIGRLEGHEDCTDFVASVLQIIRFRMLVVDADGRASSREISDSIRKLPFPLPTSANAHSSVCLPS